MHAWRAHSICGKKSGAGRLIATAESALVDGRARGDAMRATDLRNGGGGIVGAMERGIAVSWRGTLEERIREATRRDALGTRISWSDLAGLSGSGDRHRAVRDEQVAAASGRRVIGYRPGFPRILPMAVPRSSRSWAQAAGCRPRSVDMLVARAVLPTSRTLAEVRLERRPWLLPTRQSGISDSVTQIASVPADIDIT